MFTKKYGYIKIIQIMKRILLLLVLTFSISLQAQKNDKVMRIGVNNNMFVQLVFPSNVQSTRLGNISRAQVTTTDNTVAVQTIGEMAKETNLAVKTVDGRYYIFILTYSEEIPQLFYNIKANQAQNYEYNELRSNSDEILKKENSSVIKNEEVTNIEDKILKWRGFIAIKNTASYKRIELSIKGIYVHKDKLYFYMEIANKSNIKYDINKLTFITLSKQKFKRELQAEEIEYDPVYIYPETIDIAAKTRKKIIVVFNKFTLNEEKDLEVQLSEKEGERTVNLLIKGDLIVEAKKID